MKKAILVISAITLTVITFKKCYTGTADYSPLDTYIKASLQNVTDSIQAARDARNFIDSIKTARSFERIYTEINAAVTNGTDSEIFDAINSVIRRHNITDSVTIATIYKAYYL